MNKKKFKKNISSTNEKILNNVKISLFKDFFSRVERDIQKRVAPATFEDIKNDINEKIIDAVGIMEAFQEIIDKGDFQKFNQFEVGNKPCNNLGLKINNNKIIGITSDQFEYLNDSKYIMESKSERVYLITPEGEFKILSNCIDNNEYLNELIEFRNNLFNFLSYSHLFINLYGKD